MIVKVLSVVQKFVDNLDSYTSAKVYKDIELLREFGPKLGLPYSKKISNNLYELRTLGKNQVRIIYCFNNDICFAVHGFIKKSQKIPIREIRLAEQRKKELAL